MVDSKLEEMERLQRGVHNNKLYVKSFLEVCMCHSQTPIALYISRLTIPRCLFSLPANFQVLISFSPVSKGNVMLGHFMNTSQFSIGNILFSKQGSVLNIGRVDSSVLGSSMDQLLQWYTFFCLESKWRNFTENCFCLWDNLYSEFYTLL